MKYFKFDEGLSPTEGHLELHLKQQRTYKELHVLRLETFEESSGSRAGAVQGEYKI